MSLAANIDHGARAHWSTFTKDMLRDVASDLRIKDFMLMTKESLIEAIVNAPPAVPAATKNTQQFDISSTWFNNVQRLRVTGENPVVKFAHLKYDPYAGGFAPTLVLTVEYEVIDSQPGRMDTSAVYPAELEFFVFVSLGPAHEHLQKYPERHEGFEKFMDVIGKDGLVHELWVKKQLGLLGGPV